MAAGYTTEYLEKASNFEICSLLEIVQKREAMKIIRLFNVADYALTSNKEEILRNYYNVAFGKDKSEELIDMMKYRASIEEAKKKFLG